MTSNVIRGAVTLVLQMVAAAPFVTAQPNWGDKPTQSDLDRGLASLREFVTTTNYSEMGFDSKDQAQQATLGVPFRRYVVKYAELNKYVGAADPATIVRDTREWIYPVLAAGKARCLITMAVRGRGWTAVSIGGAVVAPLMVEARRRQAESNMLDPQFLFVVEVQSPHAVFVGERRDNRAPEAPGGTSSLWLTWIETSDSRGSNLIMTTAQASATMASLSDILKSKSKPGPKGK
jgi:hypothetical protein